MGHGMGQGQNRAPKGQSIHGAQGQGIGHGIGHDMGQGMWHTLKEETLFHSSVTDVVCWETLEILIMMSTEGQGMEQGIGAVWYTSWTLKKATLVHSPKQNCNKNVHKHAQKHTGGQIRRRDDENYKLRLQNSIRNGLYVWQRIADERGQWQDRKMERLLMCLCNKWLWRVLKLCASAWMCCFVWCTTTWKSSSFQT